jgi:hypothetical protein
MVSRFCSDTLISSAIIAGENAGTAGGFAGSSGGAGFEFGVDPNLDPELALVQDFIDTNHIDLAEKQKTLQSILGLAYFIGRRKSSSTTR